MTGHLARYVAGQGEELCARKPESPRLRAVETGREDLERPSLPGSSVDDGPVVRSEARPVEDAAAEGELPEGGRGERRGAIRARCGPSGRRDRLEDEGEVPRRLKTLAGNLLDAAPEHLLERGKPQRRAQGRQLFPEDGGHGLGRRFPRESALRGEELVDDDPEAEDVGAVVDVVTADLLGRHVGGRPEDDAGLREHRRRGRAVGRGLLGEAEVQDLETAVRRDEQVLGLEVAVDDPLLVGGGEALRELDRVVDRPPRGERATGEEPAQGRSFE